MTTKEPLHAIILHGDGVDEHVDIDRAMELDALQSIIGGFIEAVSSKDGNLTFWVNENGKINGLPINERATSLWWRTHPQMALRDFLRGPVVLTGGPDENGNAKSLPKCFKPLVTR